MELKLNELWQHSIEDCNYIFHKYYKLVKILMGILISVLANELHL